MTLTCTNTDTIRAGLYGRVSTADQETARQYHQNIAACERFGWTWTEYEDPGLSASRFAKRSGGENRKDYRRLLDDLAAGKLDMLVLHASSRGNRQLTYWSALLDTCRKSGVLIYITSEDWTYDVRKARDWKMLAEQGITAAMDSETMSINIKSGKAEARRAGRPQGVVAYGIFRVNDATKIKHRFIRNEADPVTGAVACRIVREAANGASYLTIAKGLDADGIVSPKGKGKWTATTVRGISVNPQYVNTVRDEHGLLDEATSLKARARANGNKVKGERPAAMKHRYSGAVACSTCGEMLRGQVRAGIPRYLCPGGHVSIPAATMDPWLDAVSIEKLSDPETVARVFATDGGKDAEAARTEAMRLRAELDEWAAADISARAYAVREAKLLPQIKAAEKRASDLETPAVLAGLPDEDRAVVTQRWESLTALARKNAFKVLWPDAHAVPTPRGPGRTLPIHERVLMTR